MASLKIDDEVSYIVPMIIIGVCTILAIILLLSITLFYYCRLRNIRRANDAIEKLKKVG
jgi:hypothetical protein